MSGNGSSACCCVVKRTKRLYLEKREIGETMSRSLTLPKGWDFTGSEAL